jgi:hypothetical protein
MDLFFPVILSSLKETIAKMEMITHDDDIDNQDTQHRWLLLLQLRRWPATPLSVYKFNDDNENVKYDNQDENEES